MVLTDVTRKQAVLAHLVISMAIFVVPLYFIIYQWYPSYYLHIDGGYRGIATIFFVHVVLGPGLTLLLFRPGKPGLKFDMMVIGIFQAVALSSGVWWVYSERPALTVFYDGAFMCMKHSEVAEVDLERLGLGDKGSPLLAVLPRPNTYSEFQAMLFEALRKKSASIYVFGEKFLPMDVVGTVQVMNYTLDVANSLSGSVDQIDQYRKIWADYLETGPAEQSEYMYFPLSCRFGEVLAVFDPEASRIIDYVPVVTARAVSRIELGFTREELERSRKKQNNSD